MQYIQYICKGSLHSQAPLSGTLAPGWNRSHHCAGSHGHLPSPCVGHREEMMKQRNGRTGRTGFASVIFSVSYGSSMVLASWFVTLAISNYLLSLKHLIYILGICGPVDLASCVHVSVLHTSGEITRISTSFMVIPGHSSLYDFSGVGTPRIYACAV
jgi:hypothetical protein